MSVKVEASCVFNAYLDENFLWNIVLCIKCVKIDATYIMHVFRKKWSKWSREDKYEFFLSATKLKLI